MKQRYVTWIASLSLAMTPFGAFRDDNVLNKKAAFTLAEVLITLGIIGIVAAMTLPTLIANYQKKVVETRLISFYSKINQACRNAAYIFLFKNQPGIQNVLCGKR